MVLKQPIDDGGPAFPRMFGKTTQAKACSCAIISRGWRCRGLYPIRKCRYLYGKRRNRRGSPRPK